MMLASVFQLISREHRVAKFEEEYLVSEKRDGQDG